MAAFAQSDRGTITGTVQDPAGGVIPTAAVVARHAETGSQYQTTTCGPQESRRALSDLLFQPIIVMQSTEDRLGSDAVTEGKLVPMAACRNIRLDGFRCARA